MGFKRAKTGWTSMSTPFLGLYNDLLELYYKEDSDNIILSDDGQTIWNAETTGLDLKALNQIKKYFEGLEKLVRHLNIEKEKPEQLDSAITWIKKGIEKFPQRLDLRMGYSTLYRMLDDAEKMYSIMEQTIDWVLKNPNTQLTWTSDNTIERNPVIEDSMQDYFTNCYYSTAHKEYAEKFADLGLRFSPKNAMFWNDKAVLKLDKDDIQGALELMEKALSFNPDDELIKDNINHLKKMLEEKK